MNANNKYYRQANFTSIPVMVRYFKTGVSWGKGK